MEHILYRKCGIVAQCIKPSTVLLSIHISASSSPGKKLGKAPKDSPSACAPATHIEDMDRISDCWLPPSPTRYCSQLGIQSADKTLISLSICLSLYLFNTTFQINKSLRYKLEVI